MNTSRPKFVHAIYDKHQAWIPMEGSPESKLGEEGGRGDVEGCGGIG
ncbi:hypothetical protein HanXRQr2_Chr11g0487681 [Helianthus annuus]|uniref:Uncharacterized protein n=1 Tax=Helianthus annuus TaxID=4232 RepID=A0A9K3HP49_HELAN|nr:hypothetical protein HanXRQr2_Chr11g0487681 [Helianthus annuus]